MYRDYSANRYVDVNYANHIVIRQHDEFTSALSIHNIHSSLAGMYTCRVQNQAASVEHSAHLKVNGKIMQIEIKCTMFSCLLLHIITYIDFFTN